MLHVFFWKVVIWVGQDQSENQASWLIMPILKIKHESSHQRFKSPSFSTTVESTGWETAKMPNQYNSRVRQHNIDMRFISSWVIWISESENYSSQKAVRFPRSPTPIQYTYSYCTIMAWIKYRKLYIVGAVQKTPYCYKVFIIWENKV